jgi:Fic family protein
VGRDRLGRPRTDADDGEELLGLPLPPGAAEVGARLGALADLLVAKTTAPALVVSALVHGELLALRPFVWGNGLVARSAARLVLVSRGLDVKAVTAPEVGHADDPAAYREAALAYVRGDVAAWVVHCAYAARIGARETLAICAAIERSADLPTAELPTA